MPVTVLRISFQPGDLGRAQRLLVPARTDRPRPLALLLVRGAPSTRKVRRAPVYPTADRRSADADGGHRPHPGSRHRHRLERAAHGHDAPGASHEARGEPNANRRGARNNRRPAHRRGLDTRYLVARTSRRWPLRRPERPRAALDGVPPAPSRRRPRRPLRRLSETNPNRRTHVPLRSSESSIRRSRAVHRIHVLRTQGFFQTSFAIHRFA